MKWVFIFEQLLSGKALCTQQDGQLLRISPTVTLESEDHHQPNWNSALWVMGFVWRLPPQIYLTDRTDNWWRIFPLRMKTLWNGSKHSPSPLRHHHQTIVLVVSYQMVLAFGNDHSRTILLVPIRNTADNRTDRWKVAPRGAKCWFVPTIRWTTTLESVQWPQIY